MPWKKQELNPDDPIVIIGVRKGPICYAYSIAAKIKKHGKCEVRVPKGVLSDSNGRMRSVEEQFNIIRQHLCDAFDCEFKEKESNDQQSVYMCRWK